MEDDIMIRVPSALVCSLFVGAFPASENDHT